jgi:hypothetical protein
MIDMRTILLVLGCIAFSGLIVAEFYGGSDDPSAITAVGSTHNDAAPLLPQIRPTGTDDPLAVSLARPLFSATRRPSIGPAEPAADLAGNRLAGIVIEPDRRLAIFAVTGGKPLTLAEGESVNGWQIESITPSEVSLIGRGGAKTLQPTLDPNPPPPRPLARAAAAPQPAGSPGQAPVPGSRLGAPPAVQVPGPPRPIAHVGRGQASTMPQTVPAPGPRIVMPPGQAR